MYQTVDRLERLVRENCFSRIFNKLKYENHREPEELRKLHFIAKLTIVAPHSLSSLSPLTLSLSVSPLTLSLQAETLSLSPLRVVASHSRLTCTTLHIDRRHSSSPSLSLIVAVPPSPSSLCGPYHCRCAALSIVISVILIIVFAVLTSLNSLNGFLVSQKQK
ncbi:uncharacterized protein LOC110266856 [Arachis ipaensis]|uniref:uncharacterized protein LOC110266856 n=1 Tax=Arachis ipaensis TaxID=130454 RepID=UPI000A2B2DAC|nr:uncharacterized protein LOC110266856 [Arachis ipaensis]